MKVSVTGCLTLLEDIYIYKSYMKFAVYVTFAFITLFHVLLVPFFITVYIVVRFVCFCLIL